MIIEINNLSQEIKSSYQYIISGMDVNNVWLVTIVGSIISALLVYWALEKRTGKAKKEQINSRIKDIEKLKDKCSSDSLPDVLSEIKSILAIIIEKKQPYEYARIKNLEGHCYYDLAILNNREDNLEKAIRSYERGSENIYC